MNGKDRGIYGRDIGFFERDITVAAIVWVGCAPSVMLNKDYADKEFKGFNLKIAPIDSLSINYEGNIDNEFPPDAREGRIKQFIAKNVIKAAMDSSIFGSITLDSSLCKKFEKSFLRWGENDSMSLLTPSLQCQNSIDSNDVWLFMQDVNIQSKLFVQLIMLYGVPVGAIPHKPLILKSTFLYWDPVKCKPIAWGSAKGSHDTGPAVTIVNWEKGALMFGKSLIKETPFAK